MKLRAIVALVVVLASAVFAHAQKKQEENISWPPKLPDGKKVVTFTSPDLLKPTDTLQKDVQIAKEAPQVDFLYFDCQTYPGNPWSVWGDGLAVGEKYFTAIGDHKSPMGNAFVFEYDSATKELRELTNLRDTLKLPEGHYTPGKIHSRLELGSDGRIYFSTHRGSTRVANDPKNEFHGDWLMCVDPQTKKTEIIAHAPVGLQSLPTGMLDPQRLIWYGGSADGFNKKDPTFFAYDCKNKKMLYSDDYGPHRAMIFAKSTGKLYFHGSREKTNDKSPVQQLVSFDPEQPGQPKPIDARLGLRASTDETPQGIVYTVDGNNLWAFDTKTEKVKDLGPCTVGTQNYTTTIDADATGRYLYYCPGAHGGAERDGTPLVQYDTKTGKRKVICFLHPHLWKAYGYIPIGTFGSAVSPDGSKVYLTWNGAHEMKEISGRVPFRSAAMSVIHIPPSEREP